MSLPLLRRELRAIHEYEADEAVLDSGSMKKVHLLGGGVSDPYGQGIEAYRACLSQISAAVNGILQELGADGR